MDNESEVIRQQMDETRSDLQDKLEILEQQVKNTVQDATEAVSETVESMKDAVQETVDTVKGTVTDTVQSVRNTFDLSMQVEAHPWAMFVGAAAVGFVATRWLSRPTMAPASAPESRPKKSSPPAPTLRNGGHQAGNGFTPPSAPAAAPSPSPPPAPAKENWLAAHYRDELAKLKGLAVGTMGGLVREMLTSSVAPAMAEQIKEVVDGITVKMGGHVMESPILPPSVTEALAPKAPEETAASQPFFRRPMGVGPGSMPHHDE